MLLQCKSLNLNKKSLRRDFLTSNKDGLQLDGVQGVEGSNPFTRPKTNEIKGLQRKL
jgi:hypothetical protein